MLGFVSSHGRLPADPALPAELRAVLATATQISPALPRSARSIEVYDTYTHAFEVGYKGITIYVDGSREIQPQGLATAS